MNPANTLAALALLALAPVALGQNPTRTIMFSGADSDNDSTSGAGSYLYTYNSPSLDIDGAHFAFDPPSTLPSGVTLQSLGIRGGVSFSMGGTLTGLHAGGTHVSSTSGWSYFVHMGGWTIAQGNGPAVQQTQSPIAQGETRVLQPFSAHAVWDVTLTPSSPHWSSIEPGITVSSGMSTIQAYATDTSGAPADIFFDSIGNSGQAWLEFEPTYEFHPIATTRYCTSQPNGFGVHESLEAYGAAQASAWGEWLTIRTRDVPENSAAVLFMGSTVISVPGGTTTLCVGGSLRRVGGVQVVRNGHADFELSLGGFLPGDTARFQCFHRDPVVGVAATDAFALVVQ